MSVEYIALRQLNYQIIGNPSSFFGSYSFVDLTYSAQQKSKRWSLWKVSQSFLIRPMKRYSGDFRLGQLFETLPKAKRTRGLSSAYQSNKFLHKSWSICKIQNLNQTSAFRPNFNFKILTKHPLHNLTKPQQQNTDHTSVSKFRLNFNFKLLTKPCAQSLNKI